jgi:two-component sensor histidine kinase
MWTSTYEGGVFKIDNGRVTGRNEQSANAEARMWASLTDRKGRIWIGSSAGLECIQNERSVGHYDGNDLPDQTVLSLLEDKSGIIWVGTAKGLCRIENDTIKLIEVPELYRTRIRCIRQQENGTLWMATLKGVLSFDGRVWTLYDSSRGIEGNSAYCLEFDNHGKLWAGLQNGLALFNGEGFSVYHLDETSASNSINFLKNIGEDLWIGTNNGLFIIANQLDAQQIAEPIRNLGLDDGLASLETNLNAVYLDSRRRLWFGTAEGLMFIELGRFTVHEEELLPRTNLTAIQLNLQTPKWSDYGATPLATTGLPFKLELPYRNNYITFFFTGISLRYPDRINYEYMLEGLDEEWKNPTYNDFATYSNLAYQSYRFALRSRIGNGRWSDPVYYEFRILPPFWLTWWFICLEVVLTICILLFIALSRSRVMKARKDREIFELRSRMLALEQQSLNSSMNRHFIFNALNSIQYYINRQDKLAANRYLSDFAKLIRKNLDSSEDNLTTLEDEVERLELYLKLEHMRFREKFEYRITISPDLDQKKIKVPAMLIQPFLENSIWHGLLPKEGQGKIEVTVQRESGQLVFTVSDNGIGIENSLSQKPSTDGHISKGMEITQGRLELLKKMTGLNIHIIGPQQVNSDSGEAIGTVVKILFPEEFTGIGYSKVV